MTNQTAASSYKRLFPRFYPIGTMVALRSMYLILAMDGFMETAVKKAVWERDTLLRDQSIATANVGVRTFF
jgi:2-hydroxychromene-2-carboxylate isomerase